MMQNKTILLISPEAWGGNFVSKHHYANYLSKNNTVYFLNPAASFTKNPFGNVSCKTRVVQHGLIIVNYVNLLPRLNAFPRWIQGRTYKRQAAQLQLALGVEKFDLIWSFDPNRYFDQRVWNADKRIYHTVDVHSEQSYESIITSTSDLVLLSSELLRPKLAPFSNKIYKIGHAADLENFKSEAVNSIKLPGENSVKAGLIANFNANNDYALIDELARQHPTIDFIFIGPFESNNLGSIKSEIASKIARLEQYKNVFFIGSKPANELIFWMKQFDINLVLYREDKRHIIINPHKMMGYFYAGKITLSSWIHEYSDASEELLVVTKSNANISPKLTEIVADLSYHNNENLQLKRRAYAEANSYKIKLEEIESYLCH